MYFGQLTAVFSLFYLNSWGIQVTGLIFIYTGVLFLGSILLQGFNLSYDKRKHMIGNLVFSLFWEGFFVLFFILHFPTLSWLSPGLYGMIIIDIFMGKRNREMFKENRKS